MKKKSVDSYGIARKNQTASTTHVRRRSAGVQSRRHELLDVATRGDGVEHAPRAPRAVDGVEGRGVRRPHGPGRVRRGLSQRFCGRLQRARLLEGAPRQYSPGLGLGPPRPLQPTPVMPHGGALLK